MESQKSMKRFLTPAKLLIAVLGIAVLAGGVYIGAVLAASTVTVATGTNTPAAKTIYNVFEDEPLLQFQVTTTAAETLDGVTITPTYSGTAGASDYALSFYSDVDGDGIVSDGDTLLLASTSLTALSGSGQLFDFSPNLSLTGTHNIIVLGKTSTGDPANADTLRLRVLTGAILLVDDAGDTITGSANGNTMTISTAAPDIAIFDGSGKPAATSVFANAQNMAIQELDIAEAAGGTGAGDTVRIVGLTPSGTIDESTDITSVKFYIDDGDDIFAAGSDNLASSTPATFAANNTKQDFTIDGGIQIGQNATTTIWIVYNLADSASNGENIIQDISAGADVTMGSQVALANGDIVALVSNTMTIDAAAPTFGADFTVVQNGNSADTIVIVATEDLNTTLAQDTTHWTVTNNGATTTYTIASAVESPAGTVTLTLAAKDVSDNKTYITDGDVRDHLKITPSTHITDVAGNAYAAGLVTGSGETLTYDSTAPTFVVTAESRDDASDQIVLTFNEPMATSSLTQANVRGGTVLALDYSTDAGDAGQRDILTANATTSWDTTGKIFTIYLNEATDEAYIPNGKYIGVTPDGINITDLTDSPLGNPAANTEVYTAAGITKEAVIPTFTIVGTSVDDAGDTIALTFNEPISTTTITNAILQAQTNILIDYDDDGANLNERDIVTANATVVWTGNTVATITLNEATDEAFIPAGKYVGVDLTGVTDLAGNAEAGAEVYDQVTGETTAPTFVVTSANSLNDANDTIVLTFNEPMSTTTITDAILNAGTNIALVYNTDGLGVGTTTLAVGNATVAWTNNTIATITLNEATNVAFLPDGEYVGVTLTAVTDLAGNATAGASYSAAAVTGETDIPTFTVTATSVDHWGDDIVLTFNESMATSTITTAILTAGTNIAITYADDGVGTGAVSLILTHATTTWTTNNTIATITLNEEYDNAYIPNGKFVSVDLTAVTDLVGNLEAGVAIYTAAGITAESAAPTFTVVGTSVNDGNDTIVLTFNEVIATSTLTQADVRAGSVLALDYSDNAGNTNQRDILTTNATAVWDATSKILTITLDEATDEAYIPAGKYIGVDLDTSVLDLAGNNEAGTEVFSSAVTGETTAPTISTVAGVSVNDSGDTIALTFNEAMSTTTITNAILQAGTNIVLVYNTTGLGVGTTTIPVANATVVWTGNTVATITLDEATDEGYIPAGKYVGVTLTGVTDLAGTAVAGAYYTAAAVTGESTVPTFTVAATSVSGWGDAIVLTFNEPMATSTITNAILNAGSNIAIVYNTGGVGLASTTLTLTTATTTWTTNNTVATITLNEATDVAFIPNGKYVGVTLTGVTDLAGNAEAGEAIYTGAITKEATAPTLSSWTLNMNTGHLTMTFSEPVDTSSLTATGITIQDAATKNVYSQTLTGGTTATATGASTVDVAMTAADFNAIKNKSGLAKAQGSSYIIIAATVMDDLVGNSVAAITDGSGVQASSYTGDSTAPTVTAQYPLNGATGVAVTVQPYVVFSEIMDRAYISTTTVLLKDYDSGTAVSASVTLGDGDTKAIITPSASLSVDGHYYIEVTTSAQDIAGTTATAYATAADQDFYTTSTDTTVPTVNSQTPVDGATDQAITVLPTVTFSENMATSTINSTNVKLKLASDDSTVSSSVTYDNKIATIHPAASLSYSTDYWIWVSGATDVAGNYVTASTTEADHTFTTTSVGAGTLALTIPAVASSTRTYATADGTYPNGWAWDFYITVPTTETSFQIKFSDWQGSTTTMATASNMRFYSAQASASSTPTTAGTITAANTYSTVMTLDGELTAAQAALVGIADPATLAGRQIKVTVEVKVPSGTTGGSWSTQYQIHSE